MFVCVCVCVCVCVYACVRVCACQYRSEDHHEIKKFRFDTTFEKIVVKLSQVWMLVGQTFVAVLPLPMDLSHPRDSCCYALIFVTPTPEI